MSQINIITGKAKRGFKIETITEEELTTRLRKAEDVENTDMLEHKEGKIVANDFHEWYKDREITGLTEEEKSTLLELIQEGYVAVKLATTGYIVCDKNGYLCSFYGSVIEIETEEFIELDGVMERNENYVKFDEDCMQVIQWLAQDSEGNYVYKEDNFHALLENTTTLYLETEERGIVSAPKGLLEFYLKRIKVVKG